MLLITPHLITPPSKWSQTLSVNQDKRRLEIGAQLRVPAFQVLCPLGSPVLPHNVLSIISLGPDTSPQMWWVPMHMF